MKSFRYFIILCSVFFSVTFCARDAAESENENANTIQEIGLPIRIIKANTMVSDSSQVLIIDDVSSILCKHEKIQKPVLNFQYDNKWVISYKIRADKSFDIYVVEKHSDQKAHSKMLITTQKEDPSSVISAVMIAYDNYSEIPGKIETEEWEATIKEDLSLKILKTYNIVASDEKSGYIDVAELSSNAKKKNEVEEIYKISDDGVIEFVENVVFLQPEVTQPILNYRALLAFNMLNENIEDVNDEWILNVAEIQMACQRSGILFFENYENLSSVIIRNEKGDMLDSLNLSKYSQNSSMGYLLLHSKKEPQFVQFQSASDVLKSVSEYFNIDFFDEPQQ